MPLGLYWLSREGRPQRGTLVAFPIPQNVRELVRERRYLPERALLLKEVVAGPGDLVCTREAAVAINGAPFGPIALADSLGRPLPHAELCAPLGPGQLYVASRHPRSFDSRAFGVVEARAIRGTVTPVWTF